ncbi:MAG: hypothetical protein ACJAS1_000529 [Oleiphilaceae bacterium]|jgi:hypothetical protein
MKTYIAKIKIESGGYEKDNRLLISANDPEEAGKTALLEECHCEIGDGAEWDEFGRIEDVSGDFRYSLHSCIEVAPEHVDFVKAYFH